MGPTMMTSARPASAFSDLSPGDRIAERLLAGPVTGLIGLLCLLQLLTWVPHYLTWPLWADHDVFATLARGWEAGLLPYRDLCCNQFPGAIYLFWILGRVAGWGGSAPIYAFDAGAVILLGLVLVLWSKRLFGRALPGIVGYLSFLGYYLELDYTRAAQRDWHSPLLAVLAILTLQGWREGIVAPAISGAAMSMALSIRPHAALFLPAVAIPLLCEIGAGRNARRIASWILSFLLTTAAWLLPLVVSRVVPDFLAGVGHNNAALNGRGLHAAALLVNVLREFDAFGFVVVAIAVCMLPKPDRTQATAAAAWLGALVLSLLYEPISPRYHAYLRIPLNLMFAVNVAVLTQLLLAARRIPASLKLVSVLLVLGVSGRIRPEFCTVRPSLRLTAAGMRGELTEATPPGYRRGMVSAVGYYNWADYRAMLNYLRNSLPEDTRIANALKGDPAIVGLLGRFSAFPAENISWLHMVNRGDEARFAKALEGEPDSVVVWSPGEPGPDPSFKIDLIESAIRRLYEPDVRFGAIEVWRRKGAGSHAGIAATRRAAAPGVGG
jgi:hypothetical protein